MGFLYSFGYLHENTSLIQHPNQVGSGKRLQFANWKHHHFFVANQRTFRGLFLIVTLNCGKSKYITMATIVGKTMGKWWFNGI